MSGDLLARIDALTDEVLDEARRRKVDALMDAAAPAHVCLEGTCGCWDAQPERCDLFTYICFADLGGAHDLDVADWQARRFGPDHPVRLGAACSQPVGFVLSEARRWL